MTSTLFPDLEPAAAAPAQRLSADRRRTKRQKDAIANGVHPITRLRLTQDADARCGNCALRIQFGHNSKTYAKCTLGAPQSDPHNGPYVSRSASTDVRSWWPGCEKWQPALLDGEA